MKTPEEIKKGLERCRLEASCGNGCPYHHEGCGDAMRSDALAYIGQLEERIALMMIQMKGDCGVCKHRGDNLCNECLAKYDRPLWEYEGLPE